MGPLEIRAVDAAIVAKGGHGTIYGVGYSGLSKLTGVQYDVSHDGKWWLDRWGPQPRDAATRGRRDVDSGAVRELESAA